MQHPGIRGEEGIADRGPIRGILADEPRALMQQVGRHVVDGLETPRKTVGVREVDVFVRMACEDGVVQTVHRFDQANAIDAGDVGIPDVLSEGVEVLGPHNMPEPALDLLERKARGQRERATEQVGEQDDLPCRIDAIVEGVVGIVIAIDRRKPFCVEDDIAELLERRLPEVENQRSRSTGCGGASAPGTGSEAIAVPLLTGLRGYVLP